MLELSYAATTSSEQIHSVWVVWTPFCAKPYSNDPRYFSKEDKSMKNRRLKSEEAIQKLESAAANSIAYLSTVSNRYWM